MGEESHQLEAGVEDGRVLRAQWRDEAYRERCRVDY